MNTAPYRWMALVTAVLLPACAFLVADRSFSVTESKGNISSSITDIMAAWGERKQSRYEIGNYSISIYAASYESTTMSLGVCPLPIIPTFGFLDSAASNHLTIFMRIWKTQNNSTEVIKIQYANVKYLENLYAPEKIRIIYRIGNKPRNTVQTFTSLPIALPKSIRLLDVEYQYPINPIAINDFILAFEAATPHVQSLQDSIRFKYTEFVTYGCVP